MAPTRTHKYIIPVDELTEQQKMDFRGKARAAAMERALKLNVIASEMEALVRSPIPTIDFGMAAGGWVSAAFAVVGTPVSVFNALTPTLANNKICCFYGAWVESLPFILESLSFREGATAGTTYAVFQMEELSVRQTLACYFSEPVWYDPQRVMNVVATPRAVGGTQRIGLMGVIIEPRGAVVSA